MLFYQCKHCIEYQLFPRPRRPVSSVLLPYMLIYYVIEVVKSNLPWFAEDGEAINKPIRIEEINRNWLVFAVEIKYLMLTRELISKG